MFDASVHRWYQTGKSLLGNRRITKSSGESQSDDCAVMEKSVGRVIPQKLGLRLKPPQLILLYEHEERGTRKRVMPLRRLTVTSDPGTKAEELRMRHLLFLERIPTIFVSKLIAIIQETMVGVPLTEAVLKINAKFTIDTRLDLNRVTDTELKRHKQLMEISFQRNVVDKNNPDFIYDKQIGFTPTALSVWDEEDEDLTE